MIGTFHFYSVEGCAKVLGSSEVLAGLPHLISAFRAPLENTSSNFLTKFILFFPKKRQKEPWPQASFTFHPENIPEACGGGGSRQIRTCMSMGRTGRRFLSTRGVWAAHVVPWPDMRMNWAQVMSWAVRTGELAWLVGLAILGGLLENLKGPGVRIRQPRRFCLVEEWRKEGPQPPEWATPPGFDGTPRIAAAGQTQGT